MHVHSTLNRAAAGSATPARRRPASSTIEGYSMYWKLMLCLTACLTGLTLLSPSAVPAQETAPSLDETMQWICRQIDNHGGSRYKNLRKDESWAVDYQSVRYEKGILTWTLVATSGNYRSIDTFRIPLQHLDPDRVEVKLHPQSRGDFANEEGSCEVDLVTTSEQRIIEYSSHSGLDGKLSPNPTEKKFVAFIGFMNPQLAERVATAFRHAIKLSGGTSLKEPF
jgi:hypothetical protein